MRPVPAAGERAEDSAIRLPGDEFSEKLRPLFVGGCQRSGTTAFADYLNEHEAVLMCQERYKRISRRQITPDLFTFERILDYRRGETNKPWNLEYYVQRHADIIARKDPARLRWIGDKNPGFIKTMDVLAQNNPGARFIMLYRPVEEVAESWDARSKNPDDHWLSGKNGFELGVETWNTALRNLREFIEGSAIPKVLIVSYHDFFYHNESCVPLISRFLELEFDEAVTRSWSKMSEEFEARRRNKQSLTDEQAAFVEERADRETEAWVLGRIQRQWDEPGLYLEEDADKALAALREMEARAWHLERRVKLLDRERELETRKAQRLVKENRKLGRRLQNLQNSRTWKALSKVNRVRAKAWNSFPFGRRPPNGK